MREALWDSPDLIKYLTFTVVALVISAGRATSPSGAFRFPPLCS